MKIERSKKESVCAIFQKNFFLVYLAMILSSSSFAEYWEFFLQIEILMSFVEIAFVIGFGIYFIARSAYLSVFSFLTIPISNGKLIHSHKFNTFLSCFFLFVLVWFEYYEWFLFLQKNYKEPSFESRVLASLINL